MIFIIEEKKREAKWEKKEKRNEKWINYSITVN